jgi:phage baseplate assembly protein gpV
MAFSADEADVFGRAAAGTDTELPLFNRAAAGSDVASAEASALMARRDAARVTLRAVFDGACVFGLGDCLRIDDLPYAPATSFVVTRLEERIDAVGGHVVEIATAPPPEPVREPWAETVWGRVSANQDPDGAGRIRCTLPTLGDVETGWLPLLRPLAGQDWGFAFVPAVGDDLLLLCPGGRAEHGVALGAVGGLRPLHLDAGEAARIGLRSAGGQALTLDDPAAAIRLETADGTRLEIDPSGARLHAAGDLTLEAPGGNVTIRGRRIDFVRG